MSGVIYSIAMLAAAVLIVGGVAMIRRGEERSRGWLMIVAGVVLVANVLVLTVGR